MLKKFTSLLLIYAVVLLSSLSTQIFAQAQPNALKANTSIIEQIPSKPDVKKAFSKDLQKSKSVTDVSEIDFKKMEKTEMKNASRAKWSKKDKALLVLIIAASVVGIVLLAIYGKVPKCSDVSCNPDYDEGCICDE
jgi:hypothetical protein